MLFTEFVATKLKKASERTTEYKAAASFISSLAGQGRMSIENQLRIWIADMIDRGLALSSRSRYIKKLSSLYKEFQSDSGTGDNPFNSIKELRDFDATAGGKQLNTELLKTEKIFDALLTDAKVRPELAVFLYLLFNATDDIENAVYLTTDNYQPTFPQLEDIINTEDFHHSRKYIFNLKQNRKRTPQLAKEVLSAIDLYLRSKEIRLAEPFTTKTILTLWILKAKKTGIRLTDLKGMLRVIPEQFEYLNLVNASDLPADEALKIKQRVAEAFSPTGKRWYAMKVRRSFDYEQFRKLVSKNFNDSCHDAMLFYPWKQVTSRVDRKITTQYVPVIPDVIFLHLQPRQVRNMETLARAENIGWFFKNSGHGESGYSVIDTNSMAIFQRMIGVLSDDMKIELTSEAPLAVGREVRITGGIMEGYTGRIYDIKDRPDVRQIYIRLSSHHSIRAEIKVEEYFVKLINSPAISAPK